MTSSAEIGNLRVRLGIDSAEFASGVRGVQNSLASLGNSLKAFATGAAAITLFNQAVTALHNVADMGDVAEAIGLTAEQLQVYNRMALASGTSADIMARGLQSIAEQSTDAKSKLSQLFDANGMSMAGKEMNQIILDFMNLLKGAKTPAEQLAIATGVLGDKVGRQLVEALRVGSSGWHDETKKMIDDGYYLAEEQVKAAQAIETRYNQLIANLSTLWQGFVVDIVKGLDQIKFEYVPGRGGARSAVANRPMPGLPISETYGGKGDLPGNINPGNGYGVTKPTDNPFNGITPPKPGTSIVPKIPQDTIDSIYGAGTAFDALWKSMEQSIPQADGLTSAFADMAQTISDSLGYALEGLIMGTMSVKDAFRSMAASVSQQMAQLASQLLKSSLLKLLQMMLGLGGGAGFTIGGMTFGGLFADGGTLGSGKWGIAGEAGPELVKGPASITPMDKLGSAAPQMNVTVINNSSAAVNTRKNSKGDLEVMIEDVLAERLIRGGNKIDAALSKGYGLRRAGRS